MSEIKGRREQNVFCLAGKFELDMIGMSIDQSNACISLFNDGHCF